MSISPLMSVGVRAMAANYAALQTTGHNIANANVTGYSRQTTELKTAQGMFTGAGFFGRGVDVATVSRAHDEFLTREASSSRAVASMDAARLTQLQRLEAVFTSGEAGLGNATSELMNALVDLSSQPADAASRRVVLARANDLASRFNEAGSALDQLQSGVGSDLSAAVAQVNSLSTSIAASNKRIADLRGQGQPANDLLDERDRQIAELSDLVQITRIDASDGSVGLFVGGGQALVLGARTSTLVLTPDGGDPSRAALGLRDGSTQRTLDGATLGGGSIAGLLRFQNEDLVQGRTLVGQLAAAVGGALNQQQLRGVSLQTPLGEAATKALFSIGDARALRDAANAVDASGQPLGTVTATIVNFAALQASEYDLRQDPASPGSWQLTRLADGQKTSVVSGQVVDGMRIDLDAGVQSGDRFLLQPVSRMANDIRMALVDPRDIAAASPLVATTDPGNPGTVSAGRLTVNANPLPFPGATTRFEFTDDNGGYTWEMLDESNAAFASGTGTWGAGQPLPDGSLALNGFSLALTGVPRSGDVITVAPTPASSLSTNNGNALALADLRDAALVGGQTATDAWAQALADVGVRVQSGKTASGISDAVAAQSELARSSASGVNLDEEAARLIQYQQSYQAAAKVLQVAQTLFDTLLQAAAR